MSNARHLSVFLCHSSDDYLDVLNLYERLRTNGVAPWLAEKELLPGQDWQREIAVAVKSADVVIACLSKKSVTKEGYVQREIKLALDVTDEKPEGTIHIIPLRLEECPIPDRLSRWHWVNLYENDWYSRLMVSLRKRAKTLGALEPHLTDKSDYPVIRDEDNPAVASRPISAEAHRDRDELLARWPPSIARSRLTLMILKHTRAEVTFT